VRKFSIVLLLAIALAALFVLLPPTDIAHGQKPLPPNDRARGLVYDGLEPARDNECKGDFKIHTRSGKVYCTHGPDAAPAGVDLTKSVPPVRKTSALAPIAVAYLGTGPILPAPSPLSTIVCDGDGVTGNRVQLIYAHASDVPDNYATYATSFQQWAQGMDNDYNISASQTGGTSHIRFVTDANCNPVIPDVTLSPTGDDNFVNTINELQALGYNRNDRKYVVFMDAHVYCGIANMSFDDQPGSANANNSGNTFGRVDAGCWGDRIPAHELMHQLGGVQLSAPHSDGTGHCNDGYDNMCDHSGHAVQIVCADPAMDALFDCNHDDYFSTNPPAGSYLATHWNAANNVFLIQPPVPIYIDSLVTGKMKGKTFSATDTFRAGETVVVHAHVVDQKGASIPGASVNLNVNRPDGSVQCTLAVTTDSTGTAAGSCTIPRKSQTGTWRGQVNNFNKTGYTPDTSTSTMNHNFDVK
jgi:hypothetical protein